MTDRERAELEMWRRLAYDPDTEPPYEHVYASEDLVEVARSWVEDYKHAYDFLTEYGNREMT